MANPWHDEIGRFAPKGTGTGWKSQTVVVRGQERPLTDISGGKWYHGSDHEIEDGETLRAGVNPKNHKQSPDDVVSITSDLSQAKAWGKFVYEIEPDMVEVWRAALAEQGAKIAILEGRTPKATVLKRI